MSALLRLFAGYLIAAFAASAGALLVDTIAIAGWRGTVEDLHTLASTAVVYGTSALAFTLGLGLVGFLLLKLLKASEWWAYASMGLLLGLLTAVLEDGFSRQNSFAAPFGVAGFAAAFAFHRVHRPSTPGRRSTPGLPH